MANTQHDDYQVGTRVIRRLDGKQGTVRELGARRTADNELTHVYVEWIEPEAEGCASEGWDLISVRKLIK